MNRALAAVFAVAAFISWPASMLSADQTFVRMVSNRQVSFVVDPAVAETVEDVVQLLIDLDANLDEVEKGRQILDILQKPEVKDELLANIAKRLGVPQISPAARAAYDQAWQDFKGVQLMSSRPVRVFLYEEKSALAAARAGKPLRYLSLDKEGKIAISWSTESASAAGEPIDVPMVVVFRKSRFLDFDTQLKNAFKLYTGIFNSISLKNYARGAYTIVYNTALFFVQSEYPWIPAWYRQGVVSWTAVYVTGDAIGLKNGLDAFVSYHPRYVNERSYAAEDLFRWTNEKGGIIHPNLMRTSVDSVLQGEMARAGATAIVLAYLNRQNKESISSEDVLLAYKNEAGVDMAEIIKRALPQKDN